MPLIRGHHSFDNNFTQIPNAWLRDGRLTFKARGLLALLLSHSQGWSLSIGSLTDQNQEGSHAIRQAIHELEKLGYLERKQINENGRFGEAIWETKDPEPLCDYPPTENPPYKNNKVKKNIKNNNDEIFEVFWKNYPNKKDRGAAVKAFASALKRATIDEIMAGVTAYANDPNRKPEFTKYPATWLNSDSWLNDYQKPDETAKNRREAEKQRTAEFLAQMEKLAEQSAPAPKCEHGNNALICKLC
jgi:hypothetical protein